MSKYCLTKKVGHGSSEQDFVGEETITFLTSSSPTGVNISKKELGVFLGSTGKAVLFGKADCIFDILSLKKSANLSARDFDDEYFGNTDT